MLCIINNTIHGPYQNNQDRMCPNILGDHNKEINRHEYRPCSLAKIICWVYLAVKYWYSKYLVYLLPILKIWHHFGFLNVLNNHCREGLKRRWAFGWSWRGYEEGPGVTQTSARYPSTKVGFDTNFRPGKNCKLSSSRKFRDLQCPQNTVTHDKG